MIKPNVVYHADWSTVAAHRWCAKAILGSDGRYTASAPNRVGALPDLIKSLRVEARNDRYVFAGFDFPIGVPAHYAERAHISRFPEFLRQLGTGDWEQFYSVCEEPEEISTYRPFYPYRYVEGCSQQHLLSRHRAANMESLLRRCERGGNGQRQACSLFWTLGAKAVGKAALTGWEHVLVPALKDNSIRLWPFDGKLESLFKPGYTVVAETYPAECYSWFPGAALASKTDIKCRKNFGSRLLSWAAANGVIVEPCLKKAIKDGFPDGEDDAFDAVVGLFGMLQICLGLRDSGEPDDETIREVEGWILGRQQQVVEECISVLSASTDPELRDWLHWASKSGEVPSFVRTIAEAAFLADSLNYALLRPVLLELKRRNPCAPCDSD